MPSQTSSSRWHMPSLRSKKSSAHIVPSAKVISAPLAISAPLSALPPPSLPSLSLFPSPSPPPSLSSRPRLGLKGLPEPPQPPVPPKALPAGVPPLRVGTGTGMGAAAGTTTTTTTTTTSTSLHVGSSGAGKHHQAAAAAGAASSLSVNVLSNHATLDELQAPLPPPPPSPRLHHERSTESLTSLLANYRYTREFLEAQAGPPSPLLMSQFPSPHPPPAPSAFLSPIASNFPPQSSAPSAPRSPSANSAPSSPSSPSPPAAALAPAPGAHLLPAPAQAPRAPTPPPDVAPADESLLSPDDAPSSPPPRSAARLQVAAPSDSRPPRPVRAEGSVNGLQSRAGGAGAFGLDNSNGNGGRSSSRSNSIKNGSSNGGRGISNLREDSVSHYASSSGASVSGSGSGSAFSHHRGHFNLSNASQATTATTATSGNQTDGFVTLGRSSSSSSQSRVGHPGPGLGPGPRAIRAPAAGDAALDLASLSVGRAPQHQCAPIKETSSPSASSTASSSAAFSPIFSPASELASSPASSAAPTLVEDDGRQSRAPISSTVIGTSATKTSSSTTVSARQPSAAGGDPQSTINARVSRSSSELIGPHKLAQPAARSTPPAHAAASTANLPLAPRPPHRAVEDLPSSRDIRPPSDSNEEDEAAFNSAAAAAHATRTMGNETSRFRHIRNKLGSNPPYPLRSDSKGTGSRNMLSKPPPGAPRRPPTPEYRGNDAAGPPADVFVSTVSPASSPEAPRNVAAGFESKALPSNPGGDYKRDDGFDSRLRNGSINGSGVARDGSINGNGVARNGSVNGNGMARNGSVNGNGMARNGSVNGNGMVRNGSVNGNGMVRNGSFHEHNVLRKGSFNEHNVVRKGSFNRNGMGATPPGPRRVGSKDLPGAPAQGPGSEQHTRSSSTQSSYRSPPSERNARAPPPLRNRPVYDPVTQRLHYLEKSTTPFSPPQGQRPQPPLRRLDDPSQPRLQQEQHQQLQMQQQVRQLETKLQQQLKQQQQQEEEEEQKQMQQLQQQQEEAEEQRRFQEQELEQQQQWGMLEKVNEEGKEDSPARDSPATPRPSQPRQKAESRLPPQESQSLSAARRRTSSTYSDMKLQEPEAPVRVIAFPRQPMQNISEKGIFKSPPLRSSHFTCYQKHRTMNRRANKHYPLTCQACDRADSTDRWVCAFCSLQICDPCTRKLQGSCQRDLSRLVDGLGHSTTPDPYSLPPSRLGMGFD